MVEDDTLSNLVFIQNNLPKISHSINILVVAYQYIEHECPKKQLNFFLKASEQSIQSN